MTSKRRGSLGWTLAAAAGAGAMYFLDPQSGAGRRARLVDRTRSRVHRVQALGEQARRDLRNRARGAEARREGSPPSRPGRGLLAENAPERRLVEGGLGAVLALWAVARRGLLGAGAGVAGAWLLARASTPLAADHAIHVDKTITIAAPVEDVYQLWSRFEDFPRFMEHVLEVRRLDGDRWHWRVTGPAGLPIEWDSELTAQLPGRKLAWRSVAGSLVEHHGEVHFEETELGITRVSVHMAYRPPGGALGHAVASFLHGDPKHLLDEDLLRVKSLLEDGKATVRHVEVRRYPHAPPA